MSTETTARASAAASIARNVDGEKLIDRVKRLIAERKDPKTIAQELSISRARVDRIITRARKRQQEQG